MAEPGDQSIGLLGTPPAGAIFRWFQNKQVPELAGYCPADFFEDCSAKHAGAIMKKSQRSGVRDLGLLRKSVKRPTPFFEQFFQFRLDHAIRISGAKPACQFFFICDISFTYIKNHSIMIVFRGSSQPICLQWDAGGGCRKCVSRTHQAVLVAGLGGYGGLAPKTAPRTRCGPQRVRYGWHLSPVLAEHSKDIICVISLWKQQGLGGVPWNAS